MEEYAGAGFNYFDPAGAILRDFVVQNVWKYWHTDRYLVISNQINRKIPRKRREGGRHDDGRPWANDGGTACDAHMAEKDWCNNRCSHRYSVFRFPYCNALGSFSKRFSSYCINVPCVYAHSCIQSMPIGVSWLPQAEISCSWNHTRGDILVRSSTNWHRSLSKQG